MKVIEYFLGPQLLGFLLFIIGLIAYKFPPKRINKFYGYRTESSMKNQETWDVANRYAARLMIIVGLCSLVAGMAITEAFNYWIKAAQTRDGLLLGADMVLGMVPVLILIVKTESYLDKTFNKKDEIH